ncbi:hypothetical protein BU26DRAFT_88500 [Trematosphaeria pertusa]|uniref:Uncharacterized protein n=1 Tax=Trematosphaeria pertusa TaxID=390896 RepID=A0A6A6I322_9PLEO|nr:uncharacterized protein BU26DRAFT_88500 [Trematosphaeria pertusa]KAF2244884.1 hypothetical protein BU26DRAFT_88500 [Trematosphaeria pertusa]
MLLTLPKPAKAEFEFKTHDYSPTISSYAAARFSPKLNGGQLPSQPASASSTMGTPHRGLPPPSAMTLPDPGRGPPPIPSSMGSLPPAPSQWQGAEDGMKNWLAAKAEEERRKQEEEKTRQEGLRLEQRKIEQSMLRESMQGGVPPHLVPMIFAGIGGGSLASISAEWIRDYAVQLQTAQQQQQAQAQAQAQAQSQLSPELRRESRLISQAQPGAYGAQPQTPQTVHPPTSVLPGQPLPSQPSHAAFATSSYASGSMSPRARAAQSGHVGAPTSAPRPPPQSQLPRLTTNEIQIQQPPTAPSNVQQLQQTQSAQQEQSSPSIYFHHWVPPTSQQEKSSGNPPATPSGKYKASPSFLSRQRAASHASDPDYTSSPKKRKAQGGHPAPPPPTSAPQSYTSPSFSHVSTSSASTPGRRGHARARSDASTRGEGHGASLGRRGTISSHPHTEAGAQQSESAEHRFQHTARGTGSHRQQQQHDPAYATAPQRNEGHGSGQHAQAESSMAIQAETRQTGPGSVSSPNRETGAQ